jgi:hypothetical protein
MKNLLIFAVATLGLPGCAGLAFLGQGTPVGFIYTDAGLGTASTENNLGRKKGEACATSILGWITTGDAGIKTAAEAAGITQISTVDRTFTNVLGIYSKFCTVVSGDAGAASGGGDEG